MGSAQHIRELSRILNVFGGQRARSLFAQSESQSKLRQLASKFANSTSPEEDAWAHNLFGADQSSAAYVRLRSRLKRILLDNLFHLELRGGSPLRRAMYRNHKVIFMVKTLLLLGARRVAVWLIPAALERAREFELTGDQVDLLAILVQDASLNGRKRDFEKYSADLDETLKIRRAEFRVNYLIQRLEVEAVAKASVPERIEELADSAAAESRALLDSFPRFAIGLGYYRIATFLAESRAEHEKCIRLCEQAERFFGKYPQLRSPSFEGEFAIRRLASSVAIRDEKSALEAIELCTKFYAKGLNNWFIWKGYEFQLYMQLLQFDKADVVLNEVATHERFASQPEQVTQKWLLYGYYLFIVQGAIRGVETPEMQRAMRAIIRQVPIYAKDKAGYHISLLILRYLALVWMGEFSTITDQSEALAQYLRRHLRDQRESALFAFLRALVILERSAFKPAEAKRKVEKLVGVFQSKEQKEIDESQIVPFTFLWGLIQQSTERYWTAQAKR